MTNIPFSVVLLEWLIVINQNESSLHFQSKRCSAANLLAVSLKFLEQ